MHDSIFFVGKSEIDLQVVQNLPDTRMVYRENACSVPLSDRCNVKQPAVFSHIGSGCHSGFAVTSFYLQFQKYCDSVYIRRDGYEKNTD